MSTAYFLKRVPLVEEKETLVELINENKFEAAINLIHVVADNKIMIGKKTGGWTFGVAARDEYEPTKEDLDLYLKRFVGTGMWVLVDSLDNEVSIDDFWAIVDEWNNDPENNLTHEKFYQDFPREKYFSSSVEDAKWVNKGYNVKYGEFINDGLRWHVNPDWK